MRDGLYFRVIGIVAGCVGSVVAGCMGSTINAGGNGDGGSTNTTTNASMATSVNTDGGPMVIASEIELTPTNMVSDGTSLFWVSAVGVGGPLSSMSVDGGTINAIVPGPLGGGALAVDQANVYYLGADGIASVPKGGGGSPGLVNEPIDASTSIESFTVLGSNAYWVESSGGEPEFAVKSAPLVGGSVTTLVTFGVTFGTFAQGVSSGAFAIGVTDSSVFLDTLVGQEGEVFSFPIGQSIMDGGLPNPIEGIGLGGCQGPPIVSDTAAIYCETPGSVVSIAGDGSVTTLGSVVLSDYIYPSGNVAVDDAYVYWLDTTNVGAVMRAPKAGGMATTIAHDPQPLAIAVDSNAVYWSDQGGNIMKLVK